jgi:hypothetical protein
MGTRRHARSAIDEAARIAVLQYLGHGLTRAETEFSEANPTLLEAVGTAIESGDFFRTHEVVGLMDSDGPDASPFYVFSRTIGETRDFEREAKKTTRPRNPALRRRLAEVFDRLGRIPERILSSGMSRLQATELRDATVEALRENGVELANHVPGAPREAWLPDTFCSTRDAKTQKADVTTTPAPSASAPTPP